MSITHQVSYGISIIYVLNMYYIFYLKNMVLFVKFERYARNEFFFVLFLYTSILCISYMSF